MASPASSSARTHSRQPSRSPSTEAQHPGPDSVPVEALVEHLLAAKRSLSSIALVLRGYDLAVTARNQHEEAVILSAQTAFLRRGVGEQVRILLRVRRGMKVAYDGKTREFRHLIKTLDGANGRLEGTMTMLRNTPVEAVFRPAGEERKTLMDFVDEKSVDRMREALKESIAELQAAQTSFDGDLLRFDTDLRTLKTTMSSSPSLPSPSSSNAYQPIPHLLASLTSHSQTMAEHLASLTRHFDMCVTAVRATEGGAALALRKAAEVTQSQGQDQVSISGVMGQHGEGSHTSAEVEQPMSAEERAEVVAVVVQDAPEVDEVVAELEAALQAMEADAASLTAQTDGVRAAYTAALSAFATLEDVGSHLKGYVAAEAEFVQRWEDEKEVIYMKLEEMDELRRFYEGYAGAYDSLLLEVERRRAVEDKIKGILRKAREGVDKIVDADRREREAFRADIGEFLPTDLWVGMNRPVGRWDIVAVDDQSEDQGQGSMVSDMGVGAGSDANPGYGRPG
ncbi:autophagy-related protein 17 [Coniochaeta sp. 2T2.1]|nr:autophagy-related protein 17 [Coniochaeta sp. 2T2.1]